jgi:hypothetical protein
LQQLLAFSPVFLFNCRSLSLFFFGKNYTVVLYIDKRVLNRVIQVYISSNQRIINRY